MTKLDLNRRNFLVGGAAAVGGLTAFGGLGPATRLAHADGPGADRYWIFCYFGGGWDTLLSLDPRDPIAFSEAVVSDTRIQPGYSFLDDETNDGSLVHAGGHTFGPYIGDLRNHVQHMAVVRGMSMETLTHEAGRRRFITGKPPSGLLARGSSGATWMAGLFGEQELIPNLSVRVETYNVDNPTYATGLSVNSVPDLLRALRADETQLSSLELRQIDQMLRDAAACDRNERSALYQSAEESRLQVEAMVTSGVDVLFDFQANNDTMAAIRDHYGIAATGTAALQTPEAQGALAVTALTAGVSRSVSIQVASNMDAHYDEWTTDHGPLQGARLQRHRPNGRGSGVPRVQGHRRDVARSHHHRGLQRVRSHRHAERQHGARSLPDVVLLGPGCGHPRRAGHRQVERRGHVPVRLQLAHRTGRPRRRDHQAGAHLPGAPARRGRRRRPRGLPG